MRLIIRALVACGVVASGTAAGPLNVDLRPLRGGGPHLGSLLPRTPPFMATTVAAHASIIAASHPATFPTPVAAALGVVAASAALAEQAAQHKQGSSSPVEVRARAVNWIAVAVDAAWLSHALIVHHDHDFNAQFGLGLVLISYVALLAGSAGPAACRNVVASGSAALSVAKCAVFFSCVAAEPFLGLGLAQWSAILLVAVAAGQWSTLEGAIRDGKVVSSPPPAKVEEPSTSTPFYVPSVGWVTAPFRGAAWVVTAPLRGLF